MRSTPTFRANGDKRRGVFTRDDRQRLLKAASRYPTLKQAARELGVGVSSLHRWRSETTALPREADNLEAEVAALRALVRLAIARGFLNLHADVDRVLRGVA